MAGKVITGARVRFELAVGVIGFATEVSIEEVVEHQPVEVLDRIEVSEHVPVAYRVSATASMVRILGVTPRSQGFGFSLEELRAGGVEVTGVVIDSVTNRSIGKLTRVKPEGRTWRIGARTISMDDVRFNAILFQDESQQLEGSQQTSLNITP